MDILYIYLPAIILFGLATCRSDMKTGKIPNKFVGAALLYGIFGLAFFFLMISRGGGTVIWSTFIEHLVNIFISILVGFFIWYLGLWSAGDGKLFIAYSALIPLSSYDLGRIENFPAVMILVNTLVPLTLFYMMKLIIKIRWKMIKEVARFALNPKELLVTLLAIYSLQWIAFLIFRLFGKTIDPITATFFIFFIYMVAQRAAGKKIMTYLIVIAALRLVFDIRFLLDLSYYALIFKTYVSFIILRYLLQMASHDVFTTDIFIENVKEGMIPAENIITRGKKYFSEKIIFIDILSQTKTKNGVFAEPADGMTKKEASKLKKIHSSGKYKPHSIKVFQTLSFAPYMFVGALLTIIVKGNLLIFIKMLLTGG